MRKYNTKVVSEAESLSELNEGVQKSIEELQKDPENEDLQISSVSICNHPVGIHMPGGGFVDVLHWDALITYSVKDPDHLL